MYRAKLRLFANKSKYETFRLTDWQRGRKSDSQAYLQVIQQTGRQTYLQVTQQTDRQTGRKSDRLTDLQVKTDRPIDRQTNRQTDRSG